MKKIATFLLASICLSVCAQDILFVNSNQNLLQLNPSFAGSNGFLRNQLSYRNQWPNLSHSNVTYCNAFDARIDKINGGLGITLFENSIAHGSLKTKSAALSYAQHIKISDNINIVPSVQVAYSQAALDARSLTFGSALLTQWPVVVPNTLERKYVTLSSGLLVKYKDLYAGVSCFHMNQPDIGFFGPQKLSNRLTLHASYTFHLSEKMLLQPVHQISIQQNFMFQRLALNGIFFNHLIAGIGITTSKSPNATVGYRADIFSVTAGYDMQLSELVPAGAGAWEVHASLNLRKKDKRHILTNFEAL